MSTIRFTRLAALGVILASPALALSACSSSDKEQQAADTGGGAIPGDMSAMNDTMAAQANEAVTAPHDTQPENGTAPASQPVAPSAAAGGTSLAAFTGDAARGEAAAATCKTCHAIDRNMVGPMLKGVVGRKAGSVAGFLYSPAMKNSGLTWTPEELFQYLEKPQAVVPGTRMTYAGMGDAQKRADVIAYLKTL